MADDRTLVLRRAQVARPERLVRADEPEVRVRRLLDEVLGLEGEIEALSAALEEFSRAWERELGEAREELAAAEQLNARLHALEDELGTLTERLRRGEPPVPLALRAERRRRRAAERAARRLRAHGPPLADEATAAETTAETALALGGPAAHVALKQLYRRLARRLHPDLAAGGAHAELGALMARANAAYAERDLHALAVLAEKVGAGEPVDELSPEERRAHLERRIETLGRIAASLARERDRLRGSDVNRRREEAALREEAGADYFAERRSETEEEAAAAYAEAQFRLGRITRAAAALSEARGAAPAPRRRGTRPPFDPLCDSELVRLGGSRLRGRAITPAARAFAGALGSAASEAPAEVAFTLLAFFAEEAGGRLPEGIATPAGLAACWDELRAPWPEVVDLPRVLARLPPELVLAARAEADAVVAGVQLANADLVAGARLAIACNRAVAALGATVLAALGPRRGCAGCGREAPARHLLRTRGLDELHGLACAGCGAILRSYFRYGEPEGLAALAPYARSLGLTAEATLTLGDVAIGFEMLPAERAALTAGGLWQRFVQLYLQPHALELDAWLSHEGERLPPEAPVGPAGARLVLAPPLAADQLLAQLRARIAARFRGDHGARDH